MNVMLSFPVAEERQVRSIDLKLNLADDIQAGEEGSPRPTERSERSLSFVYLSDYFSLVIDVLAVSPSDGTSQFDDATLKGNNNNQNKHNLFNEEWSSSQLGLRNPFKRGTQKDLYRLVIV